MRFAFASRESSHERAPLTLLATTRPARRRCRARATVARIARATRGPRPSRPGAPQIPPDLPAQRRARSLETGEDRPGRGVDALAVALAARAAETATQRHFWPGERLRLQRGRQRHRGARARQAERRVAHVSGRARG